MANHVYSYLDMVGSSPEGLEKAIRNAIEGAGQRAKNLRWFEVREIRGQIVDGVIAHWQAEVRVGATIE